MCRFLIAKTKKKTDMSDLLEKFADMAEKSRTSDGDRQGDGWGVSWVNEEGEWNTIRSLKPVWEDKKNFSEIPQTDLMVVHARSATYKDTVGDVSLNQPFQDEKYAYVFNGHLRGVSVKEDVDGRIGSEKTWFLIKKRMRNSSLKEALEKVYKLLKENTDRIFGMNVAVVAKDRVCLVSTTTQDDDYFTLWKADADDILLICSEPLEGLSFDKLPKDEVLEYTFSN